PKRRASMRRATSFNWFCKTLQGRLTDRPKESVALGLALALVMLGVSSSSFAQSFTFTSFDAPGAGQAGTFPFSINSRGLIVGYFQDPSGATHGFLRNSIGAVSAFDVPGSISTVPQSINTGGDFTGTWQGANFTVHGFLETSGGKLT